MKVLKVVAAVIIAVALIVGESVALGFVSVDKALSEETVDITLKETGIVDEMVDEVLSENTVNMGGKYEPVVREVMNSDAMKSFFSAYLTSAVRGQVYGEKYEEIGEDDLTRAFTSGMDEVKSSGKADISSMEEEIIRRTMMMEIPDMTADLNQVLEKYNVTDSELASDLIIANDDMQSFMSMGTRILVLAICTLLCAGLVALFWRSKAGFIWCSVVMVLTAVIYLVLSNIGDTEFINMYTSSLTEQFALILISAGFMKAAVRGFIIAAIFVIVYIVLKIRDRRIKV